MKLSRLLLAGVFAASSSTSAEPIFYDGFESEPVPPAGYDCNVAGVMPSQWNAFYRDWHETFSSPDGSPIAYYPNSVSFPTPVGANRGQMRIVDFQPNANQAVVMFWDEAQSRASEGYLPSRPSDGMWFAISPCAGDMRNADPFSTDPFLRPACRVFAKSAGMVWSTRPQHASDPNICFLDPTKTYFMTISPTDVRDGLQVGEHTCVIDGDFGCDVGVVTSTN